MLGGDMTHMTPPAVARVLQQKRSEMVRNKGVVPVVSLRD